MWAPWGEARGGSLGKGGQGAGACRGKDGNSAPPPWAQRRARGTGGRDQAAPRVCDDRTRGGFREKQIQGDLERKWVMAGVGG